MTLHYDVAIVGAGPAGIATALHLCQLDESWQRRLVVLEKATFPRPKPCGGGLTRMVDHGLALLGLSFLDDVPYQEVHEARFHIGDVTLRIRSRPAFRVVRRVEFDDWLYRQAVRRGIEIREGWPVSTIERSDGGFQVVTRNGEVSARVIVGADGANGIVRRSFGFPAGRRARLLQAITAEPRNLSAEHRGEFATFDFRDAQRGLQGYAWNFPCMIADRPYMNRGIVDMGTGQQATRTDLVALLGDFLGHDGKPLDREELTGAGLRWYQPFARIGGPGVLLVGDSAGVDPFAGEGIPFALGYGEIAARAIDQSFAADRLDFGRFHLRFLRSRWGAHLVLRRAVAELAYRKLTQSLAIRVASFVIRRLGGVVEIEPAPAG